MNGTLDAERSAAAVRHHYDVGDAFFALWLDRSLSYSCALPASPDDTLDAAQERKIDHHLAAVAAPRARSVLDVGCGWGAVLDRLATTHRVPRAVGLTLSDAQAAHVAGRNLPGVEVRTQSWSEYAPDEPFDGIVSVGAFEHFARPDQSRAERVGVYRGFLERCRDWLAPDGTLSLQTVAYATMTRDRASPFVQQEIFPDAELPTLAEIAEAAQPVLEIVSVGTGRADYAWTTAHWARRLRARRAEAVALVGPEVVARYERYLRMSTLGMRAGKVTLLRIVLRPYPGRPPA